MNIASILFQIPLSVYMNLRTRLPQLRVLINLANKSDLKELFLEKDEFYTSILNEPNPKKEIFFIARENTPQKKIVGFVKGRILTEKGEKLGNVLLISARKGYKGRSIGPKLLGKLNSYFIAKKVKRAELVSFNNDFYMYRSNYRARAIDADELESSIKTLEAHLKRKAARNNVLKKSLLPRATIGPQNILNKDRLIKARRRLR